MSPEEIKALRERMIFSQEEFARALNVSLQTVWRWEMGKTTPRLSHIRSLVALAKKKKSATNTFYAP